MWPVNPQCVRHLTSWHPSRPKSGARAHVWGVTPQCQREGQREPSRLPPSHRCRCRARGSLAHQPRRIDVLSQSQFDSSARPYHLIHARPRPDITRQRLLIEGQFTIEVNRKTVVGFLFGIAEHLDLRTYREPVVHSPGGTGRPENTGFDAFIPLIDSGISLYVWSEARIGVSVLQAFEWVDLRASG